MRYTYHMQVYASTFPAGFKDVIAQAMKYCVPDGAILHIDDGVVLYKSGMRRDRIIKAPCFTNTYLVYTYLLPKNANATLNAQVLAKTITQPMIRDMQRAKEDGSTFRIMNWHEGATTALDKRIRTGLEEAIQIQNVFVVNRVKPKCEFAFYTRRGGWGFFGLRLTHPAWDEKRLPAGRLDPEIAYLLSVISQPQDTDVVLDPMAGHGAIVAARAQHFPFKMILATDSDPERVAGIKSQYAPFGKQFVIGQMDATDMEDIPEATVTTIITDPPWGLHDESIDVPDLYDRFFEEAVRVLKPDGVLVVISAQKELLDTLIKEQSDTWKLHNKWNVLVHGKKAAVYKLQKQS